jgi:hypothetical protein
MNETPKLTSEGGPADESIISEEQLKKAESFIE